MNLSSVWDFICNYSGGGVIGFVRDVAYLFGGYYLFRQLKNRAFLKKKEAIEADLNLRKNIGQELDAYIIERYKSLKGIGVRLVFWKNYPYLNQDDGYAQRIFYCTWNDKLINNSWIDNIGIWFESPNWSSSSLYRDKNGIFFFGGPNRKYRGFKEFKDHQLIYRLLFKNIINFDFKEFIEYEPVIYTKYLYTDERLYSQDMRARQKNDTASYGSFILLNEKNQLRKYNYLFYKILVARIAIKRSCKRLIKIYENRKI